MKKLISIINITIGYLHNIFLPKVEKERIKAWKPKNYQELTTTYEPHMEDAMTKLKEYQDKTGVEVPVIGVGYDDYPPRRGVVIKVDISKTTKREFKVIKALVENQYVTVERQEIPVFL